ncbi:MAG: flavodoxin family protein [Pseudomonadota bacterium]
MTSFACALTAIIVLTMPAIANAQEGTSNANILIVYFSVEGHTEEMAQEVQAGAQTLDGVDVVLRKITDANTDDVLAADAIIVGSPVYNANVAPEVQSFINSWPFRGRPLENKIGAAFVSAGGISAGEETAQLSILRSMLIFGLVVVGGPDWTQGFGASAIVGEDPFRSSNQKVEQQFLTKGHDLGRRVAKLTKSWKRVRGQHR